MTEDLVDMMCPHSAAGRPERFPAKACILAGECGCVYGAEWSRALRLADAYAISDIECECEQIEPGTYLVTDQQTEAPWIQDAIAHLRWRGRIRTASHPQGVLRVTILPRAGTERAA